MTPTILCIDDDPPILSAIRRLLRREPYEVLTTSDPQEVLRLIREREINLIVADQRMPEMMGTELLKIVRKVSPRTVCVILTGHADLSDIAGAMNEGAVQRLIKKPWDDAEFREMIRRLLRAREAGDDGAEEGLEGPDEEPGPEERILARIECRGRTPQDVLEEIAFLFLRSPGPRVRFVIVFQHLYQVQGSVMKVLTGVVDEVVRSGARAALVDGTGAAGTFLQVMGGALPLAVFSTEGEAR